MPRGEDHRIGDWLSLPINDDALNRSTPPEPSQGDERDDDRDQYEDRQTKDGTKLHGLSSWGLTFDMSGGPRGAKRPLGRPLDGGVRPRRTQVTLLAGAYAPMNVEFSETHGHTTPVGTRVPLGKV